MTTLSPGLDAALSADGALLFIAFEAILPAGTIRLVDGAGAVDFGGNTFLGRDPAFGVLGAIETAKDGVDMEAPRLVVTLLPPSNTASAVLADPTAQGSPVKLWFGAVDPVSGLVIDEPDLWFVGELDVPMLRVGAGQRALEFEVASAWERFFRADEGRRLNNAFHQSVWPGERGFEYVVEVQRQLPWGADAPRPGAVTDVPRQSPLLDFYIPGLR